MSVSSTMLDSPFVSARLTWDQFMESDAGEYMCLVRANGTDVTQSRTVSLLSSNLTLPPLLGTECSINSFEAYFQLRLLDADCLAWNQELQQYIAENIQVRLASIAMTLCEECVEITPNEIEVLDVPRCSSQMRRAAVLRGRINTNGINRRERIFCALSNWQRTGPLLQINNTLHLVDTSCLFESSSSSSPECPQQSLSSLSSTSSFTLIAFFTGLVLILYS